MTHCSDKSCGGPSIGTNRSKNRPRPFVLACGSNASAEWKPSTLSSQLISDDLAITSKDYGITLRLLNCEDCGMVFSDSEEIVRIKGLYTEMSDEGYLASLGGRRLQMASLLKLALKHFPNAKNLLDVGAGAGALLVEAKKLGVAGGGIELSHSAWPMLASPSHQRRAMV